MASYKEIFPNAHAVLPVIHVETTSQTLRNAEVAYQAGANGAFLISMQGMRHEDLAKIHEAEKIQQARESSGWDGLYFGGVAFKYQRHVNRLEVVAQVATRFMDVVTTSGSGTGSAPDREKIFRMKASIDDRPLAIASGISPDNVGDYLDIADCFLVATSLLIPGTEDFDKSRVKDLIQTVRG